MGRTLESKKQVVAELRQLLDEADLALVLDYKGLSVKEMGNLRSRLREHSSTCKVAKNSLMRQAIGTDPIWTGLDPLLTGTNAFVLVKDDLGGAVKAIQAFQQETKKSDIKGGLLEGRLLSDEDLKAVGNLPSREALIAQIAGSLNGLTARLAVAIKEVPAGLARALQQHADADESSSESASPPAG
ncbi:MAG: 50S ribosomal protein L10 [Candidatus Synechococcus spongiarum 142]|uniref:Large ribosomal subunit protein uL10 n=1 Tax=Candidatus Synechococcus spongiarum 142 TaxID=1608213 RepID=A0A6N3X6E9_9SYNE|nr:MAG: 50S ribosomal protein L10 [Candidatus Synechococcus spongiarum 142]